MLYRKCACCGKDTLDASIKFFDICPVCGWEDDPALPQKHLGLEHFRRVSLTFSNYGAGRRRRAFLAGTGDASF
ncbi:MAG: hypothetical protein LBG87_08210 [Spirochaetaceae bacterium]|nr:hypothetical protein [Spirochaetaceae bacterium]